MKIVAAKTIPEAEVAPKDDPAAVFKVCKQMEVVCSRHQGLGLSAVQVGLGWQLFVIQYDGNFRHFVDCEYEPIGEDKKSHVEGCLSLPGKTYVVSRWEKVKVTGQELVIKEGSPEFVDYEAELDTLPAIVFQHEIDHARGVLVSDIGKEVRLRRMT
jgi:peptide deformylase